MKTFRFDELQLDVLSHMRVWLPGVRVAEAFELDVFAAGEALALYPNQAQPHPETPNRLTIYWAGPVSVPVFGYFDLKSGDQLPAGEAVAAVAAGERVERRQLGSRRGADFRGRFWPAVLRRIAKAQIAATLGKPIGLVSEADIDRAGQLLQGRARYQDTGELKALDLDQAVFELTGAAARAGLRLPRGTVANIDAEYDVYTADGTSATSPGARVAAAYGPSHVWRCAWRFPLASIGASDTLNDSDLQVLASASGGPDAGEGVELHPYDGDGATDPEAESTADKHAHAASGSAYATIDASGGGSKSVDLGATADGHIEAQFGGFFAVGGVHWNLDSGEYALFDDTGDADPATLTIDYTAAAGGGVGPQAYHHRHHNRAG